MALSECHPVDDPVASSCCSALPSIVISSSKSLPKLLEPLPLHVCLLLFLLILTSDSNPLRLHTLLSSFTGCLGLCTLPVRLLLL